MKSPKTTSVLTCKISRTIFAFQRHKHCHHFSWALSQKNRCNIQKDVKWFTLDTEPRAMGVQHAELVLPTHMLRSPELSVTQRLHRVWEAAAQPWGRTPKRPRASLAYPSSPRITNTWHMCSPFLPNPLKDPRNQQNAVCATWAECPLKHLHMVHLAATICWLDWACGSKNFPSLSNLRSVSSRFIPSQDPCDAISTICTVISYVPFQLRELGSSPVTPGQERFL